MKSNSILPDVAKQTKNEYLHKLKWVGMEKIVIPVSIATQQGIKHSIASSNIFVSLDQEQTKGIHMSRLYKLLNEMHIHELSPLIIQQILEDAIVSQQGISEQARLDLSFDLILNKPALISDQSGFQSYPIEIIALFDGQYFTFHLKLTLCYSSTCPCSASLSRQLTAQAINDTFQNNQIDKQQLLHWFQEETGSIATPHSQRSFAYLDLHISKQANWQDWFVFDDLIARLENCLATPVQTAVKRQDEQEFARLNAQNLMFCEDAARKLKTELEMMPFISDYQFKVEHQESLHAHNAVVIDQKF